MNITIEWAKLNPDSPEWDYDRCLYAYLNPTNGEILYIGKANNHTISQRYKARDKRPLFDYCQTTFGVTTVDVLWGELILAKGRRLSQALLADVETLLINSLKPNGNISAIKSRISSPGLIVSCKGDWPHHQNRFIDQ
jgi:hypothetical protein